MNLRQEREAKALGRAIRRARFEAGLMNPGSPKNSARRNRGSRASSAAISIAASTISSRSPARFTKSIPVYREELLERAAEQIKVRMRQRFKERLELKPKQGAPK